jgi:hypothetical protein
MVVLHPLDDGGLAGARVDLARRGGPVGVVLLQLLVPDLEDAVGVEALERPKLDEAAVQVAPDGPVRRGAGQDLADPLDLVLDRDLRPVDGVAEAPALGSGEVRAGDIRGGEDLVEELRRALACTKLDLAAARSRA